MFTYHNTMLCGLLIPIILWPAAATADFDDLSLETLTSVSVMTASRFAQPEWEAPAAITVIDRQTIAANGWRTLADIIQALPGFVGASDGVYSYAGTRGIFLPGDFNSRFLLQINGFRLNDNIVQQAMIGEEFPLDVGLIDRVEFLAGPGSPVQGANAMFGVINVVTRRGSEMPDFEAAVRVSSEGYSSAQISAVRQLAGGGFLTASAGGSYLPPGEARYDDPNGALVDVNGQTSGGVASHANDLRGIRLFLRYENDNLAVSAHYGSRDIFPGNSPYDAVFNSPQRQKVTDTLWSVNGVYAFTLANDAMVETRMDASGYTFDALSPYADQPGRLYLNRYLSSGFWVGGDVRLLYTGLRNHDLVVGVEVQQDIRALQHNYDLGTPINAEFRTDPRERQSGLYVQDQWRIGDSFRFISGLRLDADSTADSMLSPRLGLIYRQDDGLIVKVLGARAFRPANDYEREYNDGIRYLGNANLSPETLDTGEIVLEQATRRYSARISLYRYDFSNLIVSTSLANGGLQFQNNARVRTYGVEVSGRTSLSERLTVGGSVVMARSRDMTYTSPGYSPHTVLKLDFACRLSPQWSLTAEGGWISATPLQWHGTSVQLPARSNLNLTLSRVRLVPGLDATLRIGNVFGDKDPVPTTEEVPIPTLPGAKRFAEAGVRYAF
ncbi:MAG: TonB-dependent receptor [Fluviicoccus sp.]|uniref:TonB-dependent receptor plug domain-containing protein n=1 Tax=Fluviicoccus sp. TaxID=2003552 RepID=UPI002724A4EA|nr:TonB-dependent receptor [Fluviicoccus sp.]MDO8330947.1 TonB-dependent receptor [Fluviicoccus sp.]